MIHTILAAVDGSTAAESGLRVATQWAAALPAKLEGVYVEDDARYVTYEVAYSIDGGVAYPVPLPPDKLAEEKLKVAKERDALKRAFDQVAGKVADARFSSPAGGVNEVLSGMARSADLVVIGSRGRFEQPTDHRPGPTTETLLHNALRPVLVVPEGARTGGTVLIAFDDSKGVQRVLATAVELAERLNLGAVVLTVDEKPEHGARLQASLKPYLAGHGVEAKFRVEPGRAADAILRCAEQEGAGLIAMGAFGHNPIYELFFGSTTLAVLERAKCPVLLLA